jgi:hypothetical protein
MRSVFQAGWLRATVTKAAVASAVNAVRRVVQEVSAMAASPATIMHPKRKPA